MKKIKEFFRNKDTSSEVQNKIRTPDWRKSLYKKDRENMIAELMAECDSALKWLNKSKEHLKTIGVDINDFKEKKEVLDYIRASVVLSEGVGAGGQKIAEDYIDRAKEMLSWRDQLRLKSVNVDQYENNINEGVKKVIDRYMEAYNYALHNHSHTGKSVVELVDNMTKVRFIASEAEKDLSMDKLSKLNEKSKPMLEIQLQAQKGKHELPDRTLDYD